MANIVTSAVSLAGTGSTTTLYLDSAAEFSKVDRTGWHQASPKTGRAKLYDLLITATCDIGETLDMTVSTLPNNWQMRNSTRQFHLTREKLRKSSKTPKSHVGKYGKSIRYNIDGAMNNVAYAIPASISTATSQRIYAMDGSMTAASDYFDGGTWDYTQLTSEDDENGFYLVGAGTHSAASPGPYTYVSVLAAYNQHRLHVQSTDPEDDSVDVTSPLFRILQTDEAQDDYALIVKTEQDSPPYDMVDLPVTANDDCVRLQNCEMVRLNNNQGVSKTFRVLAPLGLVKFAVNPGNESQQMQFRIECIGLATM